MLNSRLPDVLFVPSRPLSTRVHRHPPGTCTLGTTYPFRTTRRPASSGVISTTRFMGNVYPLASHVSL